MPRFRHNKTHIDIQLVCKSELWLVTPLFFIETCRHKEIIADYIILDILKRRDNQGKDYKRDWLGLRK